VPLYQLEITNPDGGDPASASHDSADSLDVGDTFDHEGATLSVTAVEDASDATYAAKLVCQVEGGRPHYF
jgi:hypothetical protein